MPSRPLLVVTAPIPRRAAPAAAPCAGTSGRPPTRRAVRADGILPHQDRFGAHCSQAFLSRIALVRTARAHAATPGAVMDPRSAGRPPTTRGPRAATRLPAGRPRRASPLRTPSPPSPTDVPCRRRRFPVAVDPHRPPPDSPCPDLVPGPPLPRRGCWPRMSCRAPPVAPVARLLPRRGGGTSSTASAGPRGRQTLRGWIAGSRWWTPGRCRRTGLLLGRAGSARTTGASCCCRSCR